MALTYLSPALQFEFGSAPPPAEAAAYAARLREVENALLCHALLGNPLRPDCQRRLQRYLQGEIGRAEAFQPLYQAAVGTD